MDNIVLIGFMGCGKTEISKILSRRLGLKTVDTDSIIVKKAGMQIPEIFEKYGENYFRKIEELAVKEASKKKNRIIATGGGIVKNRRNIDILKKSGKIVFLKNSFETSEKRLKGKTDRPLFKDKKKARALLKERAPLYEAAADIIVKTDKLTKNRAAEAVIAGLGDLKKRKKIRVRAGEKPYDIYIGSGIIGDTGELLKNRAPGKKVLVVSNRKVFGYYGEKVLRGLKKYFEVFVCLLPDGEKHKTLKSAEKVYDACAKNGLDRYSTIVALGGGVIGDTAGFAAATYMRGIGLVHVPTTVIAQVDSSIGGKTGVDTKAGKNLVGAFYQPDFVISDILALKTLSDTEFKNGLAEVIKHGIIMDAPYFYFLKKNHDAIKQRKPRVLIKVIERSARLKSAVVEKDEKEKTGLRAALNYGHTIGHAIEAAAGYKRYKHGQAVVLGMAAAASMAYHKKICSKQTVELQIQMFNLFNLIKPLKNIKTGSILKRLYNDKKVKNGKIRFILTKKIGCVTFIKNVSLTTIKNCLKRLKNLEKGKEEVLYG